MQSSTLIRVAGVVAVLLAARTTIAQSGIGPSGVPGMRQADRHNPFSPRYHSHQPGQFRGVPFSGFNSSHCSTNVIVNGGSFGAGTLIWSPWGGWYNPSWGGGWYAPDRCWGWSGYPAVPLVAGDSSRLFGPRAMNELVGSPAPAAPAVGGVGPGNDRVARAAMLATNAAHERAVRMLEVGDDFFRQRNWEGALLRYRKASTAAPKLAEPHVRRAQVHIAQRRYDLAAKALRKALALEPAWPRSDFRLDRLYGRETALAREHRDAVVAAAMARPEDYDLALVAAEQLFFSGQAAESRPFLESLSAVPSQAPYASGFLDALAMRDKPLKNIAR